MKLAIRLSTLLAILSYDSYSSVTYSLDEVSPVKEPGVISMLTLYGQDIDRNNIRDDIQNWIHQEVPDRNLKRALLLKSYYHQKLLEYTFDGNDFRNAKLRINEIDNCIYIFQIERSSFNLVSELEKRFYNTPFRYFVNWLGSWNLSPDERERMATVESFKKIIPKCGFRVSNLRHLIDRVQKNSKRKDYPLEKSRIEEFVRGYGE